MSITKTIIVTGFLPGLHIKPSHRSQTLISFHSSSNFAAIKHQDQSPLWGNSRRVQKGDKSRRRFLVCSIIQPGAPPPSEPPFNFLNWIVGVAITVVLPFFSQKWGSLLKLKNEVETVVETIEGIVEAVEQVADGVEKVAEDIADDLPAGGRLRKAVDFVENVAERASKDAHIVGDFIDMVQEAEEKVEDYVESLGEKATHGHEHPKEEEEDRVHEQPKEANDEIHGKNSNVVQ